jgi:antitoxin component of RelBE/YafQ-DinJ toxin-antitoxin module
MNVKENPKSKYISFRVPNDTKIAFKKVADKLGMKMSDILIEMVESKIKEEGISKTIIDKNQTEIPL